MIDPQGQKAAGNGSKFEDIIEDAVSIRSPQGALMRNYLIL